MQDLATQRPWAKGFPLKDLKRYELINVDQSDVSGKNEQEAGTLVASLLRFFGVSSVDAWTSSMGEPGGPVSPLPDVHLRPAGAGSMAALGRGGRRAVPDRAV